MSKKLQIDVYQGNTQKIRHYTDEQIKSMQDVKYFLSQEFIQALNEDPAWKKQEDLVFVCHGINQLGVRAAYSFKYNLTRSTREDLLNIMRSCVWSVVRFMDGA